MELVDGADSGLRQIDPSLVEHGHGVGVAFGLQRAGIALERGDAGRGAGIDAVVLAPATAGKLPHPRGRSGRHVDDVFAASEQPRGEMAAEAFGVLHSPAPLRPLSGPGQHASVLA